MYVETIFQGSEGRWYRHIRHIPKLVGGTVAEREHIKWKVKPTTYFVENRTYTLSEIRSCFQATSMSRNHIMYLKALPLSVTALKQQKVTNLWQRRRTLNGRDCRWWKTDSFCWTCSNFQTLSREYLYKNNLMHVFYLGRSTKLSHLTRILFRIIAIQFMVFSLNVTFIHSFIHSFLP